MNRSRLLLALAALVLVLVAAGAVALTRGDGDTPAGPTSTAPGGVTPAQPSGAATDREEPTGPTVSVDSFGAVGDGTTDDTAALQKALDGVSSGGKLTFRDGATYVQDDILTLRTKGISLSGDATIAATNEERSSFRIEGDDVLVSGLTFATPGTTKRWDAYEQQRLHIAGADRTVLSDVTVEGSAAAGIYIGEAAGGWLLDRVTVRDTRADGIHITQGAHDGIVREPQTSGTGDDGVAVVSYDQDGAPCERIRIESPTVKDTDARGVSVVGGTDVTWTDIDVDGTAAAGVYIAVEPEPYNTTATSNVRVEGGRVARANQDTEIDHGAVLVYDGRQDEKLTDVTVTGLTIEDTRSSASRQVGVVSGTPGTISGIFLTDLTLTGGPELVFRADPGQAYTTSGLTRDGQDVPAQRSD